MLVRLSACFYLRRDDSEWSGKSTLLQILAGKRLTRSKAKVLGQAVFFNTPKGVTYLGALDSKAHEQPLNSS